MDVQITLNEVLESWISTDQEWNSKGRTINSKWSQYYHVNSICILQCKYNLFKLPVRTRSLLRNNNQNSRSQVENLGSDTTL